MSVKKTDFGCTDRGEKISLYTVSNKNGTAMKVTDYGAILVSLLVRDREGILRDVVLGYADGGDYQDNPGHFGGTIGRNGNRIADASFTLNGVRYQLAANENENNLHSGPDGYEFMMWDADAGENQVTFSHVGEDGEQGFPGEFHVRVTYTLTDEDELEIHYEGRTDRDTVANMTNHSYFNLAGHDSGEIGDQILKLNASHYTPVIDAKSIPTGEIAPVEGTPMDFREGKAIGRDIGADFEQLKFTGGYDHNYILDKEPGEFGWMAEAYSEKTGIRMTAYTDCEAVQFYAGNFIGERRGKDGTVYKNRHGFCLESQYCPNAVNDPHFTKPYLKAGDIYDTRTVYRFRVS